MKRFWLVLLSLGLVMAFSVSAFAVDVKVSGEFYAAGLSLNKIYLADYSTNPSTAFFYQRMRIGTDFVVSPCLKLVTRFDAMERIWGGDRSVKRSDAMAVTGGSSPTYKLDNTIAGFESQNIQFEIAYIDYTSPIGLIQVGYMPDYTWATIWGNRETGPTAGQIKILAPVGPVTLVYAYAKEEDHSYSSYLAVSDVISSSPSRFKTDRDYDSHRLGFMYNFKGSNVAGDAGALFIFNRDASNRGWAAGPYITKAYSIQPYFRAKIGPVALQGEVNYMFGDAVLMEYNIPNNDKRIDSLSALLDGDANLGIFSVGGSIAYVQGDDDATDSVIHNQLTGGRDWDPCLIMFNNTTANSWIGPINGYTANSVIDGEMRNAWFFQGRAGVKPTPQLGINLSVSYAMADKKPVGWAGGTYGTEIDLTGTYKITNNLTYMIGAGYLFTGDYFKENVPTPNDIVNDYILINKLTLNF